MVLSWGKVHFWFLHHPTTGNKSILIFHEIFFKDIVFRWPSGNGLTKDESLYGANNNNVIKNHSKVLITLTPAGLYTQPSNRESKFLIRKVLRSAAAKNTLETKRSCFTNTLTFHMSAKYHFFCVEIIVKIPGYVEHKTWCNCHLLGQLEIVIGELKRMVAQDFRISLGITTLEGWGNIREDIWRQESNLTTRPINMEVWGNNVWDGLSYPAYFEEKNGIAWIIQGTSWAENGVEKYLFLHQLPLIDLALPEKRLGWQIK